MKICLAGEGGQAMSYMQALKDIEGVEVASLAGGIEADVAEFAAEWGIPHHSLDLAECLARPGIEAVLLTSPSQVHVAQAEQVLAASKHLMLEIPMALNLAQSEYLAELEAKSDATCMVAHTRRFSPMYQEVHRQIQAGELTPLHIMFQIYFFRRVNVNRFGKPRTWVDDLLWHHACHAIDLIYWMLGDGDMAAWGQVGPDHGELGIPMDISVGMRAQSGCLVTGALSFNNHGPIDVSTRIIGEETTLLINSSKSQMTDPEGKVIMEDAPGIAFVNQLSEFFSAIGDGRVPSTSFAECVPAMRLLDRIQRAIDRGNG